MAAASSVSSLPWLWVLEALASNKKIDMSVLNDLTAKASGFSYDSGKNGRERVALRCLEDMFDPSHGTRDFPSTLDSNVKFDLSESCEHALHRIVGEVSSSDLRVTRPELLKWDVQTFIMHKKASLAKCALELLKDELIKGSHPSAHFLRGKSGLEFKDQNNTGNSTNAVEQDLLFPRLDVKAVNHENQFEAGSRRLTSVNQENVSGDSPSKTMLPSKRDRLPPTDQNCVLQSLEDRWSNGGDLHPNNKTHKSGPCTDQQLDLSSVPVRRNEQSEITRGRTTVHITDVSKLAQESRAEGVKRTRCSEDVLSFLKRNVQIIDGRDIESRHNQFPISNHKMPQGACSAVYKNRSVNEVSGYMEHSAGRNESNNATPSRTKRTISTDEGKDDTEDDISSDSDKYRNEKDELAATNLMFLSSQCTIGEDHMSTDIWTEQNLCMKCNKDGEVLRCFATGCPVIIHENCLGPSTNLFDEGNFYCPFCTYSRSISNYLESKKKTSRARKQLAEFISFGCKEQNLPPFLHKESATTSKQNRDVSPVNGQSNNGIQNGEQFDNHQTRVSVANGSQVTNYQNREGMDDKPQEEEIGTATINVTLYPNMGENQDSGQRQKNKVSADHKSADPSSSRKGDKATIILNWKIGTKQDDLIHQHVDSPTQEPAHEHHNDVGGTSEDDDSNVVPNYFIKFRNPKKQYCPETPLSRRKKLIWTAEEEEILKEGVRRFATEEDKKVPWKQILEFGSHVFENRRTTMDLKDKWRNLCKGSPKTK